MIKTKKKKTILWNMIKHNIHLLIEIQQIIIERQFQ